MKADTCGCCKPPAGLVPIEIINRPGLSAIAFRVGTFSSFRQSLLQAIAGTPGLSALRTRLSDDYAITILELWSTVADVLTFYQERIANEAYLRTTMQRDSILRLAKLLDYHLNPGVAATTLLAFTLEKDAQVIVPVGLRVQSVPGQNEQPQKYETTESITADFRLNKLGIYSRPIRIDNFKDKKQLYLTPGNAGLEIAESLSPGDRVALFAQGGQRVEELTVEEVRLEGEHVLLCWKTPIQSDWNPTTKCFRFVKVFRLFGVTAPEQYLKPSIPDPDRHVIYFDSDSSQLDLEAQQILQNVFLILEQNPSLRIIIEGHTDTTHDEEYSLGLSGRRAQAVSEWLKNEGIAAQRMVVKGYGFSKPVACNDTPEDRALNRRVEILLVPLAAEEFEWKLQSTDFMRDSGEEDALELDAVYEDLNPGAELLLGIERGINDYFVKLSVKRTSLASVSRGPLSASVTKVVFDEAILPGEAFDIRNVTIYELTGPEINFWGYEYPESITEATVCIPGRKIDEERIEIFRSIEGYQYKPGIEISINDFEVGRRVILHDEENKPIQATISNALIMDHGSVGSADPSSRPPVSQPPASGDPSSRPPVSQPPTSGGPSSRPPVSQSSPSGTQEYLVLHLYTDAELKLERHSAFLLGNVAKASHGETVDQEVVGSGDAASCFQQFALQKKPVTFTPYAGPGGAKNSLKVLVDKVRWNEAPTLYGKGPDDQVYITRLEEDGTLLLKFGDGNTGARLPTGRNNIVSRYRQGLGLAGRVKENKLTTLLDRPAGSKSVTNPLPASGGADPESLEDARVNAPTTVRTFDRAVSLRDFEDLVKNTGEVAKAAATWVWDGLSRAVHLTVAGQKAGLFEPPDLARIHASLTTQRDPNNRLLIDNFVRVRITITTSVSIADTHIAQEVAKDAREALLKHLSFEALEFGETIYLSDIYRVLQDVDGVTSLDIDLFHFKNRSLDHLAERGANNAPVQQYLRIFPARPMPNEPFRIRPAEQAWVEVPSEDIRIHPEGGISE